jgi:hypothetical protein
VTIGTPSLIRRVTVGGEAGVDLREPDAGKYENQILPTGLPIGTPQEALDCACDLYLDH